MDAPQRRILVVDDDPGVRTALRRAVRRHGYEVLAASSGEEALEILAQEHIDLLISDQIMPSMTGLELLRRVREKHPQVIRILLTGAADVELALCAINEGQVFRMLTKPWDDPGLRVMLTIAFTHLDQAREQQRLVDNARKHADSVAVRG